MDKHLELLKKTIVSSGDVTLLEEVKRSADEIVRALQESEFEWSNEDIELLESHPEWTATVYRALAGDEGVADEEHDIHAAIYDIRINEDAEIGTAFVQALLQDLPDEYTRWDSWFSNVPLAPEEYQAYLRKQVVVIEGMPYSEGLVKYGITPGTFFEASRGIELLADRLIHSAMEPADHYPEEPELRELYYKIREWSDSGRRTNVDLVLEKGSVPEGKRPAVPYGLLLAQIRGTPFCPLAAAEPLLQWMVEVSQLRPYFFPGYEVTPLGPKEIRLAPDRIHADFELAWRWSMQRLRRAG